jgi:NAD-dependent dihydropyrimidine dehydrogenase PreA subunit
MLREVVTIDEALCDGCGLCIPACHEGALRVIDGKARLVADRLCDGMGACLGQCPRGAIRIERREADAFEEPGVPHRFSGGEPESRMVGGCPGSRFAQFERAPAAAPPPPSAAASELTHWPVQLRLLTPGAPVLRGAYLLVAADCVPVAYANFHADLLRGHAVVIACPKLDDTSGYVEKLAAMIAGSELREITVAHMEVPCCTGILHAVLQARQLAGRDVPVNKVVVSVRGQIVNRRPIPIEPESPPAERRDSHSQGAV